MSREISKQDAYRMASNIMCEIRSSLRLTSVSEEYPGASRNDNHKYLVGSNPSAGCKMTMGQGVKERTNEGKKQCNDYNEPLPCHVHNEESSKGIKLKKCPMCSELNHSASNWSFECGTAIVSTNRPSRNELEKKFVPRSAEVDVSSATVGFSSLSNMNDLRIVDLDDDGVATYQASRTSTQRDLGYAQNTENEERLGVVPHDELPGKPLLRSTENNITRKIETMTCEVLSPFCWNIPEEIILRIFSNLKPSDLSRCAQVCRQFNCIVSDNSLWKTIVLHNKSIDDETLCKIARKRPTSLTISKCNTKKLSKEGLHYLFYMCQQTLESLDFSNSCLGDNVKVESVIQTSELCHNISSFDLSWTDVCDKGVEIICMMSPALVDISFNGCRRVTDSAIVMMVKKHFLSLETLQIFGCFNISSVSINMVALKCQQLRVLNVGQCHKVTNASLTAVARGLPCLRSLDVRGCKKVGDSALQEIMKRCPLKSLVVANCPLVTNSTLDTLASSSLQLTSFDISGIERLTEICIENVIRSCPLLKSLDISSTRATERCVFTISKICAGSLESLKLNFCRFITDSCLYAVVSSCKNLRMLLIYGCGTVRCLDKLLIANPHLDVRCDSSMRSLNHKLT